MGYIYPAAVTSFLNRPLRDSAQIKRISPGKINQLYVERIKAKTSTELHHHQKVCVLLGAKYENYIYLAALGLGKTIVTLLLFDHFRAQERAKKGLILVPNVANIEGWRDQVATHTPHLSVAVLDESGRQSREAAIHSDADLVVATYQGWCSLISESVPSKKKGKNEWRIAATIAKKLEKRFQFLCLDECSNLGNHRSLWTQAATRLSRRCPFRFGLTGTPFGRNPESLWSQFFITDRGATLGQTLGIYRAAFFVEKENYWSGWYDYKFNKNKSNKLAKMLRHGSVRYRTEECVDLPPIIRYVRPVRIPEETKVYHDKIIREIIDSKGDRKLIDSAWHQLRQISSGFIGAKDEAGEKIAVVFKDNPKLDGLIEAIHEADESSKIIVFLEYIKSGEIVSSRFTKEKIQHVHLWGGSKSPANIVKAFKEDSKTRVLLASRSGAFGHNFQIANYVVFYESPSSPILRSQMEARAYRMGQTKKVFVIDLPVVGSVDEKVLEYLKEGKDLFDAIVEGREYR